MVRKITIVGMNVLLHVLLCCCASVLVRNPYMYIVPFTTAAVHVSC